MSPRPLAPPVLNKRAKKAASPEFDELVEYAARIQRSPLQPTPARGKPVFVAAPRASPRARTSCDRRSRLRVMTGADNDEALDAEARKLQQPLDAVIGRPHDRETPHEIPGQGRSLDLVVREAAVLGHVIAHADGGEVLLVAAALRAAALPWMTWNRASGATMLVAAARTASRSGWHTTMICAP